MSKCFNWLFTTVVYHEDKQGNNSCIYFIRKGYQGYCIKLKKKSINLSHSIKLLCVYKTALLQLKTVVQDYNKSYSHVTVVYPSLYQYTVKSILPFLKCLTRWENFRNILNHRWFSAWERLPILIFLACLTSSLKFHNIFNH